tara:strand:- start:26015 stop:26308 length:294 start_codon:yes stop_codon:yes gene_type:complete
MSKNRYSARADANQPKIVSQLRKMGYSVMTGHDDIFIGHNGKNYWIEIKDPEKTLLKDGTWKAGALKDSQIKLLEEWQGQYDAVHSIEQILEIIHGK